jgi:uncharacterized protein (DUF3084 family)
MRYQLALKDKRIKELELLVHQCKDENERTIVRFDKMQSELDKIESLYKEKINDLMALTYTQKQLVNEQNAMIATKERMIAAKDSMIATKDSMIANLKTMLFTVAPEIAQEMGIES